ncbi:MAG TPA: FMN-binding protein, partial [Candidatus Ozemobacteraceae bacterium]|nr:FMN-binding protein [Candidatus Ozemobacteraceae bacterium]
MMRARKRHAYAVVSFILVVLAWLHGAFSPAAFIPETMAGSRLPAEWELAARQLAPPGLHIQNVRHGACRLEGLDDSGTVRWHAVFSAFMTPRPIGYAGAVDLVACIDDTGHIAGVRILRQNETPTFVSGLDSDWFLGQFIGKASTDPLIPGRDIDGLTHATVTVEAVCEALRRGFAAAMPPDDAAREPHPAMASPPSWKAPDSGTLIAMALAVCAALMQCRIGFVAAAAIVVCSLGLLSPQFVSLSHARLLLGRSVSAQAALVLGTALFSVILARRGYCRFLCPCGRLQDLIYTLSKAVFLPDTRSADGHTGSGVSRIGRAILWISLLLLPLVKVLPLERLEAFSALFLRNLGPWGVLLALSVIAGALLTPRFYCRKLCPLNPLFTDAETLR